MKSRFSPAQKVIMTTPVVLAFAALLAYLNFNQTTSIVLFAMAMVAQGIALAEDHWSTKRAIRAAEATKTARVVNRGK